jgi:hypothetical protein
VWPLGRCAAKSGKAVHQRLELAWFHTLKIQGPKSRQGEQVSDRNKIALGSGTTESKSPSWRADPSALIRPGHSEPHHRKSMQNVDGSGGVLSTLAGRRSIGVPWFRAPLSRMPVVKPHALLWRGEFLQATAVERCSRLLTASQLPWRSRCEHP